MAEEISSLQKLGTWRLEQLPAGRKAIKSKWVSKQNYDAAGKLVKHKARLVAKRFTQKEGVDYTDTFAPVVKLAALIVFLAVATAEDLEIHQVDVKTAYLHGELKEEIYME
jgi:RecG-like helicase